MSVESPRLLPMKDSPVSESLRENPSGHIRDRKSTRLNSSHSQISYAVFCLKKTRVSYQFQRAINASLNAATSTRAVRSNPNFVTRQKIAIIFCYIQNSRCLNELNSGPRRL